MHPCFLHCCVAGLPYSEVQEVGKELEVRQCLDQIPEPNNRYDTYVLSVALNDKRLGCLPHDQIQTVSKILQAGRIQNRYRQKRIYKWVEICL